MRYSAITATLLAIGFILTGCSKNENPLSSSQGSLSGKLSGWVSLRAEEGATISDASGVTVSVGGTSYTATTDSDGKWSIGDLPAGTYVITLSKSGYGPYTAKGYRHVGGGDGYFGPIYMGVMPNATISLFSARALDSTVWNIRPDSLNNSFDTLRKPLKHVEVTATTSDSSGMVMVFIGRSQSVSNAPGTNVFEVTAAAYQREGENSALQITREKFAQYGITPGTTVYLISYVASSYGTTYTDPEANRIVYTSLSAPSSVVSVVVP